MVHLERSGPNRTAADCAYRGEASMISGKTTLIAHVGYPTEAFKAPLIYNPYFGESRYRRRRRADGHQASRTTRAR